MTATTELTISTRTVLKVLSVTAVFLGILYFGYMARIILIWIVTAFSLALALNPTVHWVEKKFARRHRTAATLLVFGVMILAFGALGASLFRPVVGQTEALVAQVPQYTQEALRPGTWLGDTVDHYNLIPRIQSSQSDILNNLTSASGTFAGVVSQLFASLIAIVTILGLTFFMLMEGPVWLELFWRSLPGGRRSHAQRLASEMYGAVVGYVNGKLLAALLAGVSAAIMLLILGVPYAAALALVVALLSIIPMFGATIGALIVVVVCLFSSITAAIVMAVFFLIYQQIENSIIQPVIFNHTVAVSPLLVFVSVLLGTAVGGILGALIAIPVTASIQILVKDYYARRLAAQAAASTAKS